MKRWLGWLRFLWEEETAPAGDRPGQQRDEPAGVPRPLRIATRTALIGAVATSLMAQIVGVRMVAPVDAAPSYTAQCNQRCNEAYSKCGNDCELAYPACKTNASNQINLCNKSCQSLKGQAHDNCIRSCNTTYNQQINMCVATLHNCHNNCATQSVTCHQNCNSGRK
jgi:hypothetical protein